MGTAMERYKQAHANVVAAQQAMKVASRELKAERLAQRAPVVPTATDTDERKTDGDTVTG